jgi:hypothetical protein
VKFKKHDSERRLWENKDHCIILWAHIGKQSTGKHEAESRIIFTRHFIEIACEMDTQAKDLILF